MADAPWCPSTPTRPQIPRLKYGWLRLWFRFTGGRHCHLDGEGHGLPPPIRRQSLTNRRVALRGPTPWAKPAGAPPHPWGFLPRIKSGVGGYPNPSWVKTGFRKSDFPSAFRSYDHVQSRDLGFTMVSSRDTTLPKRLRPQGARLRRAVTPKRRGGFLPAPLRVLSVTCFH